MSTKKQNRSTRPMSHKEQTRHELEQLINACGKCLDISYLELHRLAKKYIDDDYRTTHTPEEVAPVDDYLKSVSSDLKSLENRMNTISTIAREKAKNYKSLEDNMVTNIVVHQEFEEWTTDYQSTIVPTMLELKQYLDKLDNSKTTTETEDE